MIWNGYFQWIPFSILQGFPWTSFQQIPQRFPWTSFQQDSLLTVLSIFWTAALADPSADIHRRSYWILFRVLFFDFFTSTFTGVSLCRLFSSRLRLHASRICNIDVAWSIRRSQVKQIQMHTDWISRSLSLSFVYVFNSYNLKKQTGLRRQSVASDLPQINSIYYSLSFMHHRSNSTRKRERERKGDRMKELVSEAGTASSRQNSKESPRVACPWTISCSEIKDPWFFLWTDRSKGSVIEPWYHSFAAFVPIKLHATNLGDK